MARAWMAVGSFFLFLAACAGAWAAPEALVVRGNQILTASSACTVRLRGVNVDSLEYVPGGNGPASGGITATVAESITVWNSNLIRVPLSQDFWFGIPNSKSSTVDQAAYRQLVDNIIQVASALNAYVLLDLHWSGTSPLNTVSEPLVGNTGWGTATAQQNMPDTNSVTFWSDVATRYANNPAVLFDLYNEPKSVSWSVWRDGGDTGAGFPTPGLQALLDVIRATGAHNVVVAGGLDWAYDLSGVPTYHLSDTIGSGVFYATHVYPWKGSAPWVVSDAVSKIDVAGALYPVLVGEFGQNQTDVSSCANCQEANYPGYTTGSWTQSVLNWINQKGYHYTAWDMHNGSSPCLITNWQFTPTTYHGVAVKADLATPVAGLGCVAGFTASPTPTPTDTPTFTPTVTGTIPTNTPTVTRSPTNTPTITNTPISTTCVSTFNGCENALLNDNGTWWGNNAALSRVTPISTQNPDGAPVGAITEGSSCMKVHIQSGTGWNNSVCNLLGFTPNVWNDVAQLRMDVYADPALIAASGAWHQLFLVADVGGAAQTVISNPSLFSLNAGANSLAFNINVSLSGKAPTSAITGLYFVFNSQNGATGDLYVDNLRLARGCRFTETPTPPVTATFTQTPTPSPTATITDTPTDTATPTATPTGTWFTATFTETPTWTVTETPTVTETITPGTEGAPMAVLFPNPVTMGGWTHLALGSAAVDAKVSLYTVAYRKVSVVVGASVPMRDDRGNVFYGLDVPLVDEKGKPLANGLYYARVEIGGAGKTLKLLLAR